MWIARSGLGVCLSGGVLGSGEEEVNKELALLSGILVIDSIVY